MWPIDIPSRPYTGRSPSRQAAQEDQALLDQVAYCLDNNTLICDHDYFLLCHFAFAFRYYQLFSFVIKSKTKKNIKLK
jgi:hypothetical protein